MDTTIKYYRKKLKIKQSDLAETLGLTITDMSFIENKHKYPNSRLAERLSELLQTPIGSLYSELELDLIRTKND